MEALLFPWEALSPLEWMWIVYVCIAGYCVGLYLLVLFLEADRWWRRVWIVFLVCVLIVLTEWLATVPSVLFNTHSKIEQYRKHIKF